MFSHVLKSKQDLTTSFIHNNTKKVFARFTNVLILSAIFGVYSSNILAANFSCTWTGGALDKGNWTDSKWNSDAGCNGTFPNNNGDTFDATHSRGIITLNRNIEIEGFNLGGGTLTGSNNLTVNKVFNWTRGTLSGAGTIRAAGGLLLNGNLIFKDKATVINSAGQQAKWSQGNIIMFRGESGFVNETGANFSITADANRMLVLGPGAKFDNDGTLTTNLSSAESIVTINALMNNRGLVDVQTGELRLAGGGTSTGSFVAGEQGKLNFRGGEHVLQAGSSISGSAVEFSQLGVANINGSYSVGNTELKTRGEALFNTELSQTETLTMSGGILSGSGILSVSGRTTFSSGEMNGEGFTITDGGLDLDGNFVSIRDTRALAIGGELSNWTNGNILLRHEGSLIFNQPGTTFRIASDGGIVFGFGAIVNAGAIVVDLPEEAEPVVIKSNVTNVGFLILRRDKLVIGNQVPPNLFDSQLTLFNGNFIQAESGTTFFNISGNTSGEDYDVLNIIENASLSGIFDISLGFLPNEGDVFDILTAKTIVDAGLTLGGLHGNLFQFEVVNLSTGNQALRLTFSPSAAPLPNNKARKQRKR